ncbi:CMRF35-like molecule 5 isoform X2 [Pleuronectes platessa]|uniref:CMRF35-like molecule 5 isoform X2 n=1 Tax=Pleuronectes platessa TaxID=8262 RepID=UPI00232A7996|nr:CMRF35-like molecule 5 isoform X2 [Pleuronectes platessa]
MNARLLLFFFSLSSLLQDGLTELVFTGPEGGSVTVSCSFSLSGWKKLFCRKSCEDGDVLIETKDDSAQRDRYSIKYEEGTFPVSLTFVHVKIKDLKKSDSGKYTCGLKRSFPRPDGNEKVEIIVTDASPSSTPSRPVEPSPTSLPAATTTAPTSSSPETSEQSSAPQPMFTNHKITPVLLTVSVIIIIIFIITLSVTVMVFCRNRTSKHTESPEPPDEDEVEAEYEEVADVRVTSSSSVEQFELYSLAQFSEPNRT